MKSIVIVLIICIVAAAVARPSTTPTAPTEHRKNEPTTSSPSKSVDAMDSDSFAAAVADFAEEVVACNRGAGRPTTENPDAEPIDPDIDERQTKGKQKKGGGKRG